MVEQDRPLVTITGMTGYIGAEVTMQFLQDGGYRVRGTVRDPNNEAKIAPLREAFGEHFAGIELAQADLTDADSLNRAIAGATYVVHVASPITGNLSTDEDYKPAVDGTLAVVRACAEHRVRRLVITSSISACQNMLPPKPDVVNETHWSVVEGNAKISNYSKSKTLAEKAAWDFQASLPEDQRFDIVTILPGFVNGPPLRKEYSASMGFAIRLMKGEIPEIRDDGVGTVDVRDVAFAHVQAIKRPEAANRRFILVHSSPKFIDLAQPIIDKYVPLGYPVTQTQGAPDPTSFITKFDNTASREVLGVPYRDLAQTMVDCADKLVELGIVTKP